MIRSASVVVALAFSLAFAADATAEVVEFVLDPSRTRFRVSAGLEPHWADAPPQAPGGDVASYAGVIRADLDGDSIRVLDGSFADAMPQTLPQRPIPGNAAGAAPADYGFVTPSTPGGPPPRYAALRDVVFDLYSDEIPLRDDGGVRSFYNELNARTRSARVDYTVGGGAAAGSYDFASPQALPGDNDTSGTLSTDGAVQTLTVPFYMTLTVSQVPGADDYYIFRGEFTATRVVPEPATAAAPLPLAALALLARRGGGGRRRPAPPPSVPD